MKALDFAIKHMSEDQLKANVLHTCANLRLKVHHDRPARTKDGWRTAIEGNPGFPDLAIAGPGGVLYRELKRQGRNPTADQDIWLHVLRASGQDVGVWRPSDWISGIILAQLRAIAGVRVRATGIGEGGAL